MQIDALAVELPAVARHPNRTPFRGVLTLVDVPSDRAPSGSRGRKVILPKDVAERALPSLIGMALDYTPAMDGHDARRKVGVITAAEVRGKELMVEGFLYARDFPDVINELRIGPRRLGLSYELADAEVEDIRAAVWTFTNVTFTGAAILLRQRAAYGNTWIELKGETVDKNTKAELAASIEQMAQAAQSLGAMLERVEAQHTEFAAKIDRVVAAVEGEAELRARIAALEKENETLRVQAEVETQGLPTSPAFGRVGTEHAASGKRVSPRKTLPSTVAALLAKNGVETSDSIEAAALDAALTSLPIEQRIAVKAQLARAGLLD